MCFLRVSPLVAFELKNWAFLMSRFCLKHAELRMPLLLLAISNTMYMKFALFVCLLSHEIEWMFVQWVCEQQHEVIRCLRLRNNRELCVCLSCSLCCLQTIVAFLFPFDHIAVCAEHVVYFFTCWCGSLRFLHSADTSHHIDHAFRLQCQRNLSFYHCFFNRFFVLNFRWEIRVILLFSTDW